MGARFLPSWAVQIIMILFHATPFSAGCAAPTCAAGHGFILEAADQAVHVDGSAGHGIPGAAVVSVSGGSMASRRVSAVGPPCVGRAAADRANAAGSGISAELAPVPHAAQEGPHPDALDES